MKKTETKALQPEGLSFKESLEYARRYHFLLLTVAEIEGEITNRSRIIQTFGRYETMVDTIRNGELEPEKLDFLKSLPSWERGVWNKQEIYEKYKTSPFYEVR